MDIKTAISEVVNGNDLSHKDMYDVMKSIMQGNATQAQIGGLLVALRLKGESIDEIAASAKVMRELAKKIHIDKTNLVDTCGTGGDNINIFNISTTSAFVVAASGAKVAKHGNRSVSSNSGSADVLEAAGVNLNIDIKHITSCIENIGIGFMFAPAHHSAMKHAIGPRRELGIRSLFNILGPLTNPAEAPNQLIGVYNKDWLKPLAQTLRKLGSKHVLIVHAKDGMDEISLTSNTYVAELKNEEISNYEIAPDDFGITKNDIEKLATNNADESLNIMSDTLANKNELAKNIVVLNAGAAIYASGIADSIKDGVDKATEAIESGAAEYKFKQLIEYTNSFKS